MGSMELIPPTRPEAFLERFTNLPVLSVKRKQWRMEQSEHDRNEADAVFQEVRKKVLDRDGRRAMPKCDTCMTQLRPYNTPLAGCIVDVDVIQRDALGRLPTWCAA